MTLLRKLIQVLLLRPAMFVLGLEIRGRGRLDVAGPAIIVANHNSHLDTAALLAAIPSHLLPRAHPAAAADYFLANRLLGWFSKNIVGVVPVDRSGADTDPLRACSAALGRGEVVILFPEGTRGTPEVGVAFRRGVAHLARAHPGVPIIPVHIDGAGHVLPKGSRIPVPLGFRLIVGEPVATRPHDAVVELTRRIEEAVWGLAA